jgi:hypothetical protein
MSRRRPHFATKISYAFLATEENFSLAEADFPESLHLMETPPPFLPEASITPAESAHPRIPESDRSWCIGLHLSGLSGILFGFALAHILVPLVIWLIKRAESPAIDTTGKEVLNFQISYSLYFALSFLLWIVLIGIPLSIALGAAWLILTIIAAIKTSNGEEYHYPYIIRFLK